MRPTPELWTKAVPTRTQIVQSSDQAIITAQLYLRPGSKVAECGTGSGVLTTAFARTVAPTGFVHTFEFNEPRVEAANRDFINNGLGSVVRVEHRDVCSAGFPENLDGTLDAIMLDVPNPWDAIGFARRSLRHGGRVCTYSPCIEQVQKNAPRWQRMDFHL